MGVALQRVTIDECKKLHEMQIRGFRVLLEKYQDFDTSPGAETLEKVRWRFGFDFVTHYWICLCAEKIGCIRIREMEDGACHLSQMFILPAFQGHGYAQEAIRLAEVKYPQA